jgi:CheY-like chemotaxis protein
MDGYEATRTIRQEEEGTGLRVPIIAMTANATPQDRARCIESGMDDYLSKPVRPALLREVLVKWMPLKTANPPKKRANRRSTDSGRKAA